jgi:hypothetical protein
MRFPGGSFFSPKPPPVVEPAPLPTREDPSVAAKRNEENLANRRRRGRAASAIAGPENSLGEPNVTRPQARGAQTLG